MVSLSGFLSVLLLVSSSIAANQAAIDAFKRVDKHLPKNNARAWTEPVVEPRLHKRASPYLNNDTAKFVVDGTKIPEVDFDIGDSFAGLLPISDNADETRKLFFWFFPSDNPDASEEIAIWFTGGPGCSSLSALLSENGPFLWQSGTLAPTPNTYSWSNLTNMVWVEQPVGVGFTQGTPNITNEVELSQQFAGFWKNFVSAFRLQGRKMYITGESYGGFYVPYVADEFITQNDTTFFNLSGVAINDPILGDGAIQQGVWVVPFLDYWSHLFGLNDTFTTDIHELHEACGYAEYIDTFMKFPPPQMPFPDPNETCNTWGDTFDAALEVNPCFNIYHITDTCPHLWSVEGRINRGDYVPPGEVVYFNRTDVQAAINAPVGTNWMQCTTRDVFVRSDQSPGPAQVPVLQRVIDHNQNAIIGVGNLDYILATNGTLMVLQNTTWGGLQGFQEFPGNNTFFTPYHQETNGGRLSEAGAVGTWGTERGLTFYQIQLAGHELPGYTAGSGYRVLEKLLGRIESFSETGDFSTQTGDFTGTTPLR